MHIKNIKISFLERAKRKPLSFSKNKGEIMRNLVLMIIISLCLAGCLEFVKVNPDGSGTIEQTVLMNKEIMDQMQLLAKTFDANGKEIKKDFNNIIDKKELIEDAKSMGEGVSFIKAKPLSTKDQVGYIAYYSFKDINKVKINETPSGKTPLDSKEEQQPLDEPMKFSFERGTPAKLVIRQPEKSFAPDSTSGESKDSVSAGSDAPSFETIAEMMKGFRISIVIQCNGKITETNATHVSGSQITLMDVDFEQLMRNKDKFEEISKHNPASVLEMKKILEKISGVKMELSKEIMVQFK
jgi:hypothetical protein